MWFVDTIIEHIAPHLQWRWRKVCPTTKRHTADHFVEHRLAELGLKFEDPHDDSRSKLIALLDISSTYGVCRERRSLFSRKWQSVAGWNSALLSDCDATDPSEAVIEIYEEICKRLDAHRR